MNDQAKLLLSAYRPGGQDADDPAFAEALALAQRDPHLQAWLRESQEFDRTMAAHLQAVNVPADLRGNILAGVAASRPAGWWRSSRIWAVAAAVLLLASLAALWESRSSDLPAWQRESLAVLEGIERSTEPFDLVDQQVTPLVSWLTARGAPVPGEVPIALANKATFGCKTFLAAGRPVSLICFDLGGDQAHLFTTAHAGLTELPPRGRAVFTRHGGWHLALWTAGEKVHLLASQMPEAKLRALLPANVATALEGNVTLASLP